MAGVSVCATLPRRVLHARCFALCLFLLCPLGLTVGPALTFRTGARPCAITRHGPSDVLGGALAHLKRSARAVHAQCNYLGVLEPHALRS